MPYTDQTAVENYLLTSIDVAFATQLVEWIDAMSRHMDQFCGRTLVNNEPGTKLYDGTGDNELLIDDVHNITAVTIDGVTFTPYAYPANSACKRVLRFNGDIFPAGMQNVSVAGTFGRFTTLPNDLKFACTVLVAGIINQANKQTDGVQSEKIGEYTVTYKNDQERADFARATAILNGYRKIAF
jgi:hypothetical protein